VRVANDLDGRVPDLVTVVRSTPPAGDRHTAKTTRRSARPPSSTARAAGRLGARR